MAASRMTEASSGKPVLMGMGMLCVRLRKRACSSWEQRVITVVAPIIWLRSESNSRSAFSAPWSSVRFFSSSRYSPARLGSTGVGSASPSEQELDSGAEA